jgi:hypothetical protein
MRFAMLGTFGAQTEDRQFFTPFVCTFASRICYHTVDLVLRARFGWVPGFAEVCAGRAVFVLAPLVYDVDHTNLFVVVAKDSHRYTLAVVYRLFIASIVLAPLAFDVDHTNLFVVVAKDSHRYTLAVVCRDFIAPIVLAPLVYDVDHTNLFVVVAKDSHRYTLAVVCRPFIASIVLAKPGHLHVVTYTTHLFKPANHQL